MTNLKSVFIDPARNVPYVAAAIALSIFVFAYSTRLGPVSILAFYGCWLPLLALAPGLLLGNGRLVVLLLLMPGLAVLSTLWSEVPSVTLRAAIQYASTALCGIIAARVSTPRTLALGGTIGSIGVLVYSYMYGHYAYDPLNGSYAFAGAFASKNQLGLFASLGVIFSVATLAFFRIGIVWKLCALGVLAFSGFTLARADSATATLTLLGALTVMTLSVGLMKLPPLLRRVALALGGLAVVALFLAALEAGLFERILVVFGKDATITGRTYLWREGIEAGHENPLLGIGYSAFWTHGRLLAERLWELFYISGRTGFHFHNTFIEAYVGLGLIGMAMMLALEAGLIALGLRVLMNRRRRSEAILCVALALLFVVRSLVEIDFFTPYTIGAFLVYYLLLQMSDQRRAEFLETNALREAGLRPTLGLAPLRSRSAG